MRIFTLTVAVFVLTNYVAVECFFLNKKVKKEGRKNSPREHRCHHGMPHRHAKHVLHASHHMMDFHHGGEVEIHEMDIAHASDFAHMVQHHDMDQIRFMGGSQKMSTIPIMAPPSIATRMPLIAVPMNSMVAQMALMQMMTPKKGQEQLRALKMMANMKQSSPITAMMRSQQPLDEPSVMDLRKPPLMRTIMNAQRSPTMTLAGQQDFPMTTGLSPSNPPMMAMMGPQNSPVMTMMSPRNFPMMTMISPQKSASTSMLTAMASESLPSTRDAIENRRKNVTFEAREKFGRSARS